MEIVLVLHNIRSTYNVGAILRSAEGFGLKDIVCSGYTPWFKKPELLPHLSSKLERQIHKTALGAEEMLSVRFAASIAEEISTRKNAGYTIVGLENNLSVPTISLTDKEARKSLGDKIVLVLGEEVEGIPDVLRAEIDKFIEIPMRGQKESFNVSVAAGIALFVLTASD